VRPFASNATLTFRTFCGEIDTLLVPGGLGVEEKKPDAAAVQWLQKATPGEYRDRFRSSGIAT
jgi:hypothetical protein